MSDIKRILYRDVSQAECPWLERDYLKGEVLHEFHGCTYGCTSRKGRAMSLDGETPFFEIPNDALGDPVKPSS